MLVTFTRLPFSTFIYDLSMNLLYHRNEDGKMENKKRKRRKKKAVIPPPKPKKKFYQKWWFYLIIAIVVIGGIGNMLDSDKKEADTPEKEISQPSSSETKEESKPKTEKTTKKETKKTKENKQEEKEYKIGEDVKVGDVLYKINSKETADSVGSEFLNSNPNEKYLILDVTIKNEGKKAITIANDFIKIYKGETEFESDFAATGYANMQKEGGSVTDFMYQKLNPESSITGKVVFDIPESVINDPQTQIQVQTGAWGTQTQKIKLND